MQQQPFPALASLGRCIRLVNRSSLATKKKGLQKVIGHACKFFVGQARAYQSLA